MRIALVTLATLALAGCGTVKVPAIAEMDGGEVWQGQATASLADGGRFVVFGPDGTECAGTYDALSTDPTLRAPFDCTDGRTGRIVATRSADLMSGSGRIYLDDGSQGQFVFGDLVYSMGFGTGAATTR